MNKLKYFLFLLPFCFSLNVFAQDYNVTSSITSPSSSSTGKYTGTEIYNSGTSNVYSVNTRYNGQLSRIIYNLPVPDAIGDCYWTNVNYKVTMNMATNDWRNRFGTPIVKPYSSFSTNWATSNISFVSKQKITFTFKIPSSETSCIDFVYIDIPSTSISSTAFTGETNWNLSSIILTDPSSSGGGSSGGGGSSTTPDYSAITDNQNKNTQNIITNNDNNTSNIIENNNQNTQDIIENNNQNFNHCIKNYLNVTRTTTTTGGVTFTINSDKSITINGTNTSGSTIFFSLGSSFTLEKGTYTLSNGNNNVSYNGFLFYDDNRNFTNAVSSTKTFVNSVTIRPYIRIGSGVTINNQTIYPMIINNSSTISNYIQYGNEFCSNRLDDTNTAINDVNNSINNPNIDSDVGNGFFNNFNNNMHGLSSIITIPLSSIQSLSSSTCTPLHFPIPFTDNKYLDVPCMTEIYEQHVPTLLTLIQTCWYGILAYKVLVNIFGIVKGFKDPDSDKIEVMDL